MNWFIVDFFMKCGQSCSLAFENAMFCSLSQNFTTICHCFCQKMSEVTKNAPHAAGTVALVAAKSNRNCRMNWFIVEILLNIMRFLMKCCQSCSLALEMLCFFSLS